MGTDRGARGRMARVAGVLLLAVVIAVVYRDAARSTFFNDDVHWLQNGREFDAAAFADVGRYERFYRPIVEVYFAVGYRLFGCRPAPYHIVAICLHLLMALLVWRFGLAFTGRSWVGGAAALIYSVLPGHVQAVAWISAISEQLATILYVLTLWLHLCFLRTPTAGRYALTFASYAFCHLTHESAATLLLMMVALEAAVLGRSGSTIPRLALRRAGRYAPFALLLGAYLVIAFAVGSRLDVTEDGHYRLGVHAVRNALDYCVSLYVDKHNVASYVLVSVVLAGAALLGTARVRFLVAWILVTMAPFLFFTWGNAGRYLYLPAAGFALLLAEGLGALHGAMARRLSAPVALAVAVLLVAALSVRFAVFAAKGSSDFLDLTRPYDSYMAAVRRLNPPPRSAGVVYVDARSASGIPSIYWDPAAEAAFCEAGIHAEVR